MILTAACALFTVIAATSVLSHGSGTFTALIVFMPLLIAPGIAMWLRPRSSQPASLWAFWAFLSSIVYLITGDPYQHERVLPNWPWVAWGIWLTITLAFVGSTVVSFLISTSTAPEPPTTVRTRRIQQGVRLILALAVVSMGVTLFVLDLPPAATMFFASFLVFTVSPAPYVYRTARRGIVLFWAFWTTPLAGFVGLFSLGADQWIELPLRATLTAYGTLIVMIMIVLPLAAFVSSGEQSDMPTARIQ